MASQTLTQMQQSTSAAALPGAWKLAAGRAITLEPREPGTLKVAHGKIWATYDGPHTGALNDLGDHIVGVGGQLPLRPGQRLVVEASNSGHPAYFTWDPLAQQVAAPRFAPLVQPLADLRLALTLGAGAVGRLAVGLAGLAWNLVTGRGRDTLTDCALDAQSRACRPHGAIS